MDPVLDQFFLISLFFAGIGGWAVLHCAAAAVKNHHQVHDLKVRVNQLRTMQMKKAREKAGL
jgi:hypothetical protein